MTRQPPSDLPVPAPRWLRPEMMALPGYEPVEPPEALAQKLGLPPERIVKLDANENPYGPSPRALEAIARCSGYHIYPDPLQRRVRSALARYLALDEQYILAGSGADELLDILVRLTISPGEAAVDNVPTFGMYSFVVELAGGRVVAVRRRDDFGLDTGAVRRAVQQGAKLVFVCSPNNPTGNLVEEDELRELLSLDALIVLDEAYTEFAGRSFAQIVPRHENLAVLRTFSKWAALAGLRAGYAVMPKALTEIALKVKMPYNLNVAAEAAVTASLADASYLMSNVEAIIQERERFQRALADVPFLQPFPSSANFILCGVQGLAARDLWRELRQRGVMVRYYNTPLLSNYIRITVGRRRDSERLLEALTAVKEDVHDGA